MSNTNPEFHPILTLAQTAIGQLKGTCLAEDAAEAAGRVLTEHWVNAIRDWGSDGPDAIDVERMITGDIRDSIDALERLLAAIERRDGE